jgi:hypothetical protein
MKVRNEPSASECGQGRYCYKHFLNFAGLLNKGGTALIHGPKAHIFFFPSFLHSFN